MNARKKLIQAARLTLATVPAAQHDEQSAAHTPSDCFVCALRSALSAAELEDEAKPHRRTKKNEQVKLWEQ